jgi:hypothetical protein
VQFSTPGQSRRQQFVRKELDQLLTEHYQAVSAPNFVNMTSEQRKRHEERRERIFALLEQVRRIRFEP